MRNEMKKIMILIMSILFFAQINASSYITEIINDTDLDLILEYKVPTKAQPVRGYSNIYYRYAETIS